MMTRRPSCAHGRGLCSMVALDAPPRMGALISLCGGSMTGGNPKLVAAESSSHFE